MVQQATTAPLQHLATSHPSYLAVGCPLHLQGVASRLLRSLGVRPLSFHLKNGGSVLGR